MISRKIGNDDSSKPVFDVPSLSEIENRFYNLNDLIDIKVDYIGYIKELNAGGPFIGRTTVSAVINMLNRDINVILSESDLVKMRNSLIYYNEYYVKNNPDKKPAYVAFVRIDDAYKLLYGIKDAEFEEDNPFVNDVFKNTSINSSSEDDIDDALSRYMNKKRMEIRSASSKYKSESELNKITPAYINIINNLKRPDFGFEYDPIFDLL